MAPFSVEIVKHRSPETFACSACEIPRIATRVVFLTPESKYRAYNNLEDGNLLDPPIFRKYHQNPPAREATPSDRIDDPVFP
jgi:hypothetical protein